MEIDFNDYVGIDQNGWEGCYYAYKHESSKVMTLITCCGNSNSIFKLGRWFMSINCVEK